MQRGYQFSAWVSLWVLVLMCNQVTISLGELVSVSDCTCPGYELKLQCMITGIGFVEWRGTALYDNCTINFRTSGFEPGIRGGSCNNGTIVGHWIERQGQNYTSQLTILVDTMLSGKTVICVNNDLSRDIIVGEHVITLTTDYPFEPPSDVRIDDVGLKTLTFNWSRNQNLDLSCGVIHYNISATGCGVCPNSTSNTSVTCADVTLSPNSTMPCSFSVLPFICSNIVGNTSNTAFIALESPSAPSLKSITPHYSSTSKLLIKLEIEILTLDSVTNQNIEVLSTNISTLITSYTIDIYSDSNDNCASVNIPASSCVRKSCIQVFDDLNKSCLMNSTQIVVTAVASSYFGRGLQSVPVFIGTNNTRFDVEYDFTKRILFCHFSEWHSQDEINKSCSLVYGLLQNFDNCEISLKNRNISIEKFSNQDSVIIPLSKISTDELVYCFVAKGTVMMMTIAIEGTFKWGKKTSSAIDVQKTIFPIVSCIVVILTIITIASGVIIIKRWKHYQPPSSAEQNIYVSCTGPGGDLKSLKHSIGEATYIDIQPCLSEVQTVPLDDDVVVYAEVNHELALVDKSGPAVSSQLRTCISKQSEDEGQHTDNMKSQTDRNLPNLDNLLIKLCSISHLWYQFGLAVGISQNVLDSYNSELPPDQCLVEVLNYWLTHHYSKPTWQDVTKALNEMKLFHLAENTSKEWQTVPDTVSPPMDSS